MEPEQHSQYLKIAKAIAFLRKNFKSQPSLEELAALVNLSPHHFQRVFQEWAGVSPKKFIQYLSINYAKSLLQGNTQLTLLDTAYETGLSGTGRLYDLFINIEGMTPGEYKSGGSSLCISYFYYTSIFGEVIIASTSKGICHIAFADDREHTLVHLKSLFPLATYTLQANTMQQAVLQAIGKPLQALSEIKLHLKGTEFQLKVWEALLKIPCGHVKTYGHIAQSIGKPSASRAVGTAIGDNPIAFLIPCHRVIRHSGEIGGYHWGSDRKAAILGWEAAQTAPEL